MHIHRIVFILLANNTDYIGTLCKDCKGFQNDVVTKTLKAGERIMNYEQNTGIVLTKWKEIFILSSCVSNETKNVTRAGKPKQITLAVDVGTTRVWMC